MVSLNSSNKFLTKCFEISGVILVLDGLLALVGQGPLWGCDQEDPVRAEVGDDVVRVAVRGQGPLPGELAKH